MGIVYLIHLFQPLKHARHYVGYVDSQEDREVEFRLEQHYKGRGSKFLRACNQAKIYYDIVKIWVNVDRHYERKIKRHGHVKKYCPECQFIESQKKLDQVTRI